MAQKSFKEALKSSQLSLQQLSKLQKEAVLRINELKSQSKAYMEQVANLDDGFEDSAKGNQEAFDENIAKLTENIVLFNQQIGQQQEAFSSVISKLLDDLDELSKHYQGLKGEMTDLMKCRKSLLFVELSIRKYKAKIHSLQLMNNALFSFSQEIQEAKAAYKENLIKVSKLLSQAVEDCDIKIKELEEIIT